MADFLRQIVSSPRVRHPEAGLDLCYLTDNIVVTSGPSSVWPKKAYRNPVDKLVEFLDKQHGEEWAIFEFRAEGTGYPDEEVYNRIHHFPWPDHHPPPFAIIPNLMAAMRNWLQDDPKDETKKRVAVLHCKAGKGRSGTVACSYLISQEGWEMEDALRRFTLRRMRAFAGDGVSIPSQQRWVRYVNRWANDMNKKYMETPIEIVEIHVWGLRSGVKVCVEGFIEDGKRIKNFYTFIREDKTNVDEKFERQPDSDPPSTTQTESIVSPVNGTPSSSRNDVSTAEKEAIQNVILRPAEPVRLETSDVNIDFERRNKSGYTGLTMVTSIAHVWFNAHFEGGFEGNNSGLFEVEWDAMDGIKGSSRRGIRALDRMKVIWKYSETGQLQPVDEPRMGEPVKEGQPTDWRGEGDRETETEGKNSEGLNSGRAGGTALTLGQMSGEAAQKLAGKDLGLRASQVESANISRASSINEQSEHKHAEAKKEVGAHPTQDDDNDHESVKPYVPEELNTIRSSAARHETSADERHDTDFGKKLDIGIGKLAGILAKWKLAGQEEASDKSAK